MEVKKEYLNEEHYQKTSTKFKKVAKTVLIIGIVMVVVGIILFVLGAFGIGSSGSKLIQTEKDMNLSGILGGMGLTFIGAVMSGEGLTVITIGGILMLISHSREISAFTTQQQIPIVQEKIEKTAPIIGNVAGEVVKGIKKGLNEADKEDK